MWCATSAKNSACRGYRVSYEYGGEVYTTRMATHPGETIRVRVHVTPVG